MIGFMVRIGCLSEGSNAEKAARKKARRRDEIVNLMTMGEVFSSLVAGRVDLAVVPVYNIITGDISYKDSIKMLGFEKVDEEWVRIRHCIGSKMRQREDVGYIISHSEALKQCRDFLERNYSWACMHEWGNTGDSARLIRNVEGNGAAVADIAVCKRYRLNVLDKNIVPGNKSLFWIVKNGR